MGEYRRGVGVEGGPLAGDKGTMGGGVGARGRNTLLPRFAAIT